jgi:hypothetical protein
MLRDNHEFLVKDKHHVLTVRYVMEFISLLDGTLEAEAEYQFFNQLEHITIGF